MKPQRAFGVVTATVVAACLAAWLTPQHAHKEVRAGADDGLSTPVVFSVR